MERRIRLFALAVILEILIIVWGFQLDANAQTPPTQPSTMQQARGNEAHIPTLLDGQIFLASPSGGPLHHFTRLYVGGANGSGTAGNQLLWDFGQTVVNSVNGVYGSLSFVSGSSGLVVTTSGATISLGFGAASGDMSGTYPALTVTGLQGRSVASTAPSSGQVLAWSGSSWTPTTPAAASTYPVVSVAFSGGATASQTILPTVSSSVAGTILRVSSDGVPTGHTYTLELPNTTPLSDGYVLRIERSSEASAINVYTYAVVAGSGDATTGIVGPNNQFVAGVSPPGSLPVGLTNGNATLTLTLDKSNHVWHVTSAQDGSTAISEVQVGGSPILSSRAVNLIAGSGVTISQAQTSYAGTSGTGSGGNLTNITISSTAGGFATNYFSPTVTTYNTIGTTAARTATIAAADNVPGAVFRYEMKAITPSASGATSFSTQLVYQGQTVNSQSYQLYPNTALVTTESGYIMVGGASTSFYGDTVVNIYTSSLTSLSTHSALNPSSATMSGAASFTPSGAATSLTLNVTIPGSAGGSVQIVYFRLTRVY